MGHHHRHHGHHLLSLSFHHHHGGSKKEGVLQMPPKGCMAIRVGQEEEEEQQRFLVPLVYLNHPLFIQLLNEAEEEYGFEHEGAITIPCHVEYFRHVQGIIDRESGSGGGGGGRDHFIHFPLSACFRVN